MPPVQDEQEKPSSSIQRRFKLSRACDRCRRRRIKCDEGHPCQACQTANSPCTFEEPGKRSHPHKSKRTATLEDRMHQLETLIQAIPPSVFSVSFGAAPHPMSEPGVSSPLSTLASANHMFPSGVPPPSLHSYPLTNPSTHFTEQALNGSRQGSPNAAFHSVLAQASFGKNGHGYEHLPEEPARISLSASYLYFDHEGYTRWQGETSGLPLLDLLLENNTLIKSETDRASSDSTWGQQTRNAVWFPDRTPRRTDVNPDVLWRLITSSIVPELMDSLVQCYLCTSYYLLPFLHVPTFLADYGNPRKWGEPGFAAFIVAVCCLASRHIDDPRVRSDPSEGMSAGTQWFELFGRLRTLPIADRPTLYTIQADLIAAVYAVGLGKLSKAAALLSEAVTVSIDAGLHRSAHTYDLFDPIEDEVRKRTFWCVYIWDKQLSAHFGRPPMIRVRECDIGEPTVTDDEFITRDGILSQPAGTESRMSAFTTIIRIMIVLESVLDIPPSRHRSGTSSPFLSRALSMLSDRRRPKDLVDEETLLDEIHRSIPTYWSHTSETLSSDDVLRVTQAVRLHCAEQYVRMLIHRHRLSNFVAERVYSGLSEEEPSELERDAMTAAQSCALQIISSHTQVAAKGLMTYYGVHVIHQLTQAGRTLVAIVINCKSEKLQRIMQPALEGIRSCVALLRRFSGKYVCGQRSGDVMEEFCRLTQIPLEPSRPDSQEQSKNRPPWIRPVRKKTPSMTKPSSDGGSHHSSPESFSPSEFFTDHPGLAGPPTMNQAFTPPTPNSVHSTSPYGVGSRRISLSYMDSQNNLDVDPNMYMSSPGDMMSIFNDAGVEVPATFPTDFHMGSLPSDHGEALYRRMNCVNNLVKSP
ncbi:fungal-specific transcription factor domain-containing protein [Pisolithus marmoratus]|nr:fungal-specific transcription factor domain-containing protein [Pisolithus marmoratus]